MKIIGLSKNKTTSELDSSKIRNIINYYISKAYSYFYN